MAAMSPRSGMSPRCRIAAMSASITLHDCGLARGDGGNGTRNLIAQHEAFRERVQSCGKSSILDALCMVQ